MLEECKSKIKMSIENIPESYIDNFESYPEVFVYDFRMTEDIIKTKVNLNMHMFSFLQIGQKQVHFADTSVQVDSKQSLLIRKGNCLWSELIDSEETYYCKLLFFSEPQIRRFLGQNSKLERTTCESLPYFVIENDSYLSAYFKSLSLIDHTSTVFVEKLLAIKLEELLVYLLYKYGDSFENYLISLIHEETSSFKKIIDQNVYSSLTLEEIAFLCNMSLSTFKRHFVKEYAVAPGKWLRDQRLLKAKELLTEGHRKASEIYLDFGYNNLSNFSNAFKTRFGISPSDVSA